MAVKALRGLRTRIGWRTARYAGAALLVAALAWVVAGEPKPGHGPSRRRDRVRAAPPPWADAPGGQRPPAPPRPDSPTPYPASKRTAPAPVDPKTGLPAASAGSNGSFTPPPPGERKQVYAA